MKAGRFQGVGRSASITEIPERRLGRDKYRSIDRTCYSVSAGSNNAASPIIPPCSRFIAATESSASSRLTSLCQSNQKDLKRIGLAAMLFCCAWPSSDNFYGANRTVGDTARNTPNE
jgi:hypothetical protein